MVCGISSLIHRLPSVFLKKKLQNHSDMIMVEQSYEAPMIIGVYI